jgi:diacylglycerol kinase
MEPRKFTLRSRIESFRYALNGLWSVVREEHNARIHLVAAAIAIVAGLLFRISRAEWMLITIVIGMVFIAELVNSAIEAIGDNFVDVRNEKIKKAKDYAAAAVLVSAIISAIVGGLVFIPKIFDLF